MTDDDTPAAETGNGDSRKQAHTTGHLPHCPTSDAVGVYLRGMKSFSLLTREGAPITAQRRDSPMT